MSAPPHVFLGLIYQTFHYLLVTKYEFMLFLCNVPRVLYSSRCDQSQPRDVIDLQFDRGGCRCRYPS